MTCGPCFSVLAPPYLAPDSSKPLTPTFLMPHVIRLGAHAMACGALSLDGVGW